MESQGAIACKYSRPSSLPDAPQAGSEEGRLYSQAKEAKVALAAIAWSNSYTSTLLSTLPNCTITEGDIRGTQYRKTVRKIGNYD